MIRIEHFNYAIEKGETLNSIPAFILGKPNLIETEKPLLIMKIMWRHPNNMEEQVVH
jgi:hypothetical protein